MKSKGSFARADDDFYEALRIHSPRRKYVNSYSSVFGRVLTGWVIAVFDSCCQVSQPLEPSLPVCLPSESLVLSAGS